MKLSAMTLLSENESIWFMAAPNRELQDSFGEPYLDSAESAVHIQVGDPTNVYLCAPPEGNATGELLLDEGILLATGTRLVFRPCGGSLSRVEKQQFLRVTEALSEEADAVVKEFLDWAIEKPEVTAEQLTWFFLDRPTHWLLGLSSDSKTWASLSSPIPAESADPADPHVIRWFDLANG
jgi:hypothetical protein